MTSKFYGGGPRIVEIGGAKVIGLGESSGIPFLTSGWSITFGRGRWPRIPFKDEGSLKILGVLGFDSSLGNWTHGFLSTFITSSQSWLGLRVRMGCCGSWFGKGCQVMLLLQWVKVWVRIQNSWLIYESF